MLTFSQFIAENSENKKSSFSGVNVKGEHVGGGWHHDGNHYYVKHDSIGHKDGNGTARESVRVHYDHTKNPDEQKSEYRRVHMSEHSVGHVAMTKEKGKPAKYTAHVRDRTMSVMTDQHHKTEHTTFNKAFKHVMKSHAEMHKKAVDHATAGASMHSYRHFKQDGNKRFS